MGDGDGREAPPRGGGRLEMTIWDGDGDDQRRMAWGIDSVLEWCGHPYRVHPRAPPDRDRG